uniref:CS domain-containing protein n=1 Tax=Oncorhynchus tshawytscha TaxID=74940 RepID=A0A8C8EIC8_ONCTS
MPSSMEMIELYDNALLGILQHVGNIHNFLEVYFGFLYRKTDFYRLLSTPNDRMCFSPGSCLFEHRELQQRHTAWVAPPPWCDLFYMGHLLYIFAQLPYKIDVGSFEFGRISLLGWNRFVLSRPIHLCVCLSISGHVVHQASPGSCIEAVRDTYSWSQDYTYAEVRVNIPKTVVKGSQVTVATTCVCLKEGTGEKVLMEEEQTHKINTENSLWNLDTVCLSVRVVRCGAVQEGEKEIDVNQINRECSMATVDEEEHSPMTTARNYKPQSHEMVRAHTHINTYGCTYIQCLAKVFGPLELSNSLQKFSEDL